MRSGVIWVVEKFHKQHGWLAVHGSVSWHRRNTWTEAESLRSANQGERYRTKPYHRKEK